MRWVIAGIALVALAACRSSAWDTGSAGEPSDLREWQVKHAAGISFLIGEHADAEVLLDLIRSTSEAFKRLVGQPVPLGMVLVIDDEAQIPLTSAYGWFATAEQAKAEVLRNPLPTEDELQLSWRAEMDQAPSLSSEESGDLIALIESQRYRVVVAPFAMDALLFAELLELPEGFGGELEWGLFAASDGLSNSTADELITLGLAAENASMAERAVVRMFRDKARSGILKQSRNQMQAELFATWIALVDIEPAAVPGLLTAYIDELAR